MLTTNHNNTYNDTTVIEITPRIDDSNERQHIRLSTSDLPNALAAILEPGFSVQEAIEMILADDEEEFESDLFIAPPEPSLVSDEDSRDEDSEGDFNNFNRNQLLADAELRPRVLTDRLPDTGKRPNVDFKDILRPGPKVDNKMYQ
ncbi:hypothetical protein RN001_014367 [Aquatica leii]|uniref:Uncharacterized protein n=1 Tax=Aquatica leii TaxID=1421715 RepID=A0AAN7SKH3_9COLE|nr:hypothetical protein RN001_014367 [Aquatica leii]